MRTLWAAITQSGPELILPLLVTLVFAELDRHSTFHSPDVDFGKRRSNPISLRFHSDQGNDKIILPKYVVHVNAERTSRKLHGAPEEACEGVMALKISRERTTSRNVPSYFSVEYAKYSGNVSVSKLFIGFADNSHIDVANFHG